MSSVKILKREKKKKEELVQEGEHGDEEQMNDKTR